MATKVYRMIHSMTGEKDPYYEYKRRTNRQLLDIIDRLRDSIEKSDDPLLAAAIAAANGNMIDCGISGAVTDEQIEAAIHDGHEREYVGCVKEFASEVEKAKKILYLADNSGEIVLDRLLIERLPMEKITLAVRGKPIINDVLIEDAEEVGLCDMVKVIDNGSDAPGTVLEECSDEFRQAFDAADLVISKGQGNYETLSHVDKNIIFLFKAKCQVVAQDLGVPRDTLILKHKTGQE